MPAITMSIIDVVHLLDRYSDFSERSFRAALDGSFIYGRDYEVYSAGGSVTIEIEGEFNDVHIWCTINRVLRVEDRGIVLQTTDGNTHTLTIMAIEPEIRLADLPGLS